MFLPNYEKNEKVSLKEIKEILSTPLNDLIFKAQTVHKNHFQNLTYNLPHFCSLGLVHAQKIVNIALNLLTIMWI